MRSEQRRLAWLCLALSLFGGTALFAQHDGGPPPQAGPRYAGGPPHGTDIMPPDRWWDDSRLADKLHISAEQQEKMDSIFDQNRPKLLQTVRTLQGEESALGPLMAAEHPNEQAILGQIDHVAEARAQLEKTRARMLLALRAQLTHEQWLELIKDRMSGPPHEPGGQSRPGGGPSGPPGAGGPPPGEHMPPEL